MELRRALPVLLQGLGPEFVQAVSARVHADQSQIVQQGQVILERRDYAWIVAPLEEINRLAIEHPLSRRQRKITAVFDDDLLFEVLRNVAFDPAQDLWADLGT